VKILILAAGKGSRLTAAGAGVPKPLIDIGGVTPLQHNLEWAAAMSPECIWINVHEGAGQITERVGTEFAGVPIRYSHEPALLGTAGAWKKLESDWDATSLVIYGDNFMRFDLPALLDTHRRHGCTLTVGLFDPGVHLNTGIGGGRAVAENGRVRRFVEGGHDGLINAGVYAIEPSLAGELPSGFLDFGHDVLPRLAEAGDVAAHVVEEGGYCLGVDTPERLAIAREMVRTREISP
jgi:mannose-1-phosphate guanylyltransferase